MTRLGLEDLEIVLREKRLRWFGHLERYSGAIRTAYDKICQSMGEVVQTDPR